MNKTKFLLFLLFMSLAVAVRAMTPIQLRINGVTLSCFGNETLLDASMNEQFLKGVYLGSTTDLNDEDVYITQLKQSGNYVIAVLKVDKDYYVATYKSEESGIIDGTLLLKNKDIELGCDFLNPGGNRMNAEAPTLSLEEKKVSVTRNYTTHVNTLEMGGPIITEVGSFTTVYNVDNVGKISLGDGSQHSKWIVENNTSVPGNKFGRDVTESDRCRTLGPGINVISLYTTPVSQENKETANRLEVLLKQFDEMMAKANNNNGFEGAAKCMVELEMSQKDMVLRNPHLWLSWLDQNPKTRSMEALNKSLEDEDYKAELLKEVKSLKDKKLRKAWEKRLK